MNSLIWESVIPQLPMFCGFPSPILAQKSPESVSLRASTSLFCGRMRYAPTIRSKLLSF